MTKNEQIIQYIESLPVGEKISVRGIAKQLHMSEGTAYRAIKDAESLGIVSTIERVGTIRIEKKTKYLPEMLTYEEIVRIIDGEVLGGHSGLKKHLNKFIIGAMTEDVMVRYFTPNSLILVGNRSGVQQLALENDLAVLVTGGFDVDDHIIELANAKELPLMVSSYDTFTVAMMINRSMNDQMIKKDILTIKDVYTPIEQTEFLTPTDTVNTFHQISDKTGLSRFPVTYNNRLIGVVTAKDLIGKSENTTIERVMTKNTVTVQLHVSIANVSHRMIWEDIEMIPVVADNLQLLGVVSRQDVMKAMQTVQQQPQTIHTFEDEMALAIEEYPEHLENTYDYRVYIQPQMINNYGTISYGVLCELVTLAAKTKMLSESNTNGIIEKIQLDYFSLIQIGNEVNFKVDIFHQTRRSSLVQVDVFHENSMVAKAIISTQIIDRN